MRRRRQRAARERKVQQRMRRVTQPRQLLTERLHLLAVDFFVQRHLHQARELQPEILTSGHPWPFCQRSRYYRSLLSSHLTASGDFWTRILNPEIPTGNFINFSSPIATWWSLSQDSWTKSARIPASGDFWKSREQTLIVFDREWIYMIMFISSFSKRGQM